MPFDWRGWARRVWGEAPAGMPRLEAIDAPGATLDLGRESLDRPDGIVERLADTLEAAADGAVLVEVRFGPNVTVSPPEMMALFRVAEERVRERYPRVRAEAIAYALVTDDPRQQEDAKRRVEQCLEAVGEGLAALTSARDRMTSRPRSPCGR